MRNTMLLMLAALVALQAEGCGNRRLNIARDGGTVLEYEVDKTEWEAADDTLKEAMKKAIANRIAQVAVESQVNFSDSGQVQVTIPGEDYEPVKRVKVLLGYTGHLEFLIVANRNDHADLIEAARKSTEREVRDGDTTIGRWVTVGRSKSSTDEMLVPLSGLVTRDADTKQPIEVTAAQAQAFDSKRVKEKEWLAERGISTVEALLVLNPTPALNIQGHHLLHAEDRFDEYAQPCVNFTMTKEGGVLLELLTSNNLPDPNTGSSRRLGIVLDEELLTAPTIQSTISTHGRITGKFSEQEVRTIAAVLESGRLPLRLSKSPVSETRVSGKQK